MAYSDLRAQLVTIITGTTPAANRLGWPAKYVEAENVDREGRVRRARAFQVLGAESRIVNPLPNRRMREVDWTIVFHLGPLPTDRKNFDLALQADRTLLGDRLVDPTKWDAANTGFMAVRPSGDPTQIPFSLDLSDPEDVKDSLRLSVLYRS